MTLREKAIHENRRNELIIHQLQAWQFVFQFQSGYLKIFSSSWTIRRVFLIIIVQ